MTGQVLSDIKVLDLTWYIAGPYCTKLLADYGADVTKIENPRGGDPARRMGPFFKDDPHHEKSGLFLHLNTNKKSITLNLKSEAGKRILKELVKDAGILVESFSPRVMPSLGLDYETLEKIKPELVMTSISNFGQTGPYRDFKTSELITYGMGGSMNTTGLPSREPLKKGTGTPVLFAIGSMAALSTLIAFYMVKTQGIGQHVDVSMFEAQMASIDRRMSDLIIYQYNNEVTPRYDPKTRMNFPVGTYPCKDGYWDITSVGQLWPNVGKMMGMPELVDDSRFNTLAAQAQPGRKGEFDAIFMPWCMEHTKSELVKLGQEAGCLCAPLSTAQDLLNDPHLQARDFWADIEHPTAGKLTYPGAPIKAEEMPWVVRSAAPLLGEHNEEIYCGKLGYSKEDLVKLKEGGVI